MGGVRSFCLLPFEEQNASVMTQTSNMLYVNYCTTLVGIGAALSPDNKTLSRLLHFYP